MSRGPWRIWPGLVLAAAATVTGSRIAAAHTIGISRGELTLLPDGSVKALEVFSKADAERLGRVDTNQDGFVSEEELAASEAVFREEMEKGVRVLTDGQPCTGSLLGGGDVGTDGFGLSMVFACPLAKRTLTVELPVLDRLGAGHRQTVRIVAGELVKEDLVTAVAPSLTLTLSGARVASSRKAFLGAIRMGVAHILTGWDHLAFLLALLLGARQWKGVILATTAFTVAHSITLALATLDVVAPSARFVEPAIAASIAFVAFENAARSAPAPRWRIAFVFGLVHGFGFAGALRELGLASERIVPTLLGFNLGVEIGQIGVIAVALPAIVWLCRFRAFETRGLRGLSVAMGVLGVTLCVARIAGG